MEWAVLVLVAAAAAAFIAWPRRGDALASARTEAAELRAERDQLLLELREIDEDASARRISTEDRLHARRALAPQLRQVTEALRELGEPVEMP